MIDAAARFLAILLAAFVLGAGLSGAVKADTVTLSWTAPAERVDGTSLSPTDLAAFYIYYDVSPITSPAAEADDLVTATPGQTAYTRTLEIEAFDDPAPFYFYVTAVDHKGRESDLSNEATKVLHDPLAPPAAVEDLAAD